MYTYHPSGSATRSSAKENTCAWDNARPLVQKETVTVTVLADPRCQTLSPPFAARLARYAAGSFEDMRVSHPLWPSPRLPSARPRRAAHPLPRCARSRHGRRPPRSPPLRAAGAQPRSGHLRIHHGEAMGRKWSSRPSQVAGGYTSGRRAGAGAGAQAHFPGEPEGEEAGRVAATHC